MLHKDFEARVKEGILANGYIIGGGVSFSELADFLRGFGEVHAPEGSVGIDEIREIKERASAALRDKSSRLFFVLNAEKMHWLAFPALLKAVEEPLKNRHFFILASHPGLVPATVRSRLVEVSGEEGRTFEDAGVFGSFLDNIENYARAKSNFGLLRRLEKTREASGALNISRKMCLEYL